MDKLIRNTKDEEISDQVEIEEKPERYTYLLCYSYELQGAEGGGFGNVDFSNSSPIETIEDIRGVERELRSRYNFKSVVLVNFLRIKDKK